MKTVSSEKLRMILQNFWPDLTMIWPTDPIYELIPVQKLKWIVEACSVSDFNHTGYAWDCDNFALQFHAKVQRYQYDEINAYRAGETPWAIGECLGIKFGGVKEDHALNICVTPEGIYLIEPQSDTTWMADKVKDIPFLVKF